MWLAAVSGRRVRRRRVLGWGRHGVQDIEKFIDERLEDGLKERGVRVENRGRDSSAWRLIPPKDKK